MSVADDTIHVEKTGCGYWLTPAGYQAIEGDPAAGDPLDGRARRRVGWVLTDAARVEMDRFPRRG